jgi:hypothetical protein
MYDGIINDIIEGIQKDVKDFFTWRKNEEKA